MVMYSFSRISIDALVKDGFWISLRAGPIITEVALEFLSIRFRTFAAVKSFFEVYPVQGFYSVP